MTGSQEAYPTDVVSQLGVYGIHVLRDLREDDEFICIDAGGRLLYHRQYIDGMVQKLALYPPELRKERDGVFFRLCTYQWQYHNTAGMKKHARLQQCKRIKDKCDALVARGDAYLLAGIAPLIGKERLSVYRWHRAGILPVFKIGTSYYVSARYAQYLITVYTKWLTVAEAANATGLSEGRVLARINNGEVPATMCADKKYRIDPAVVEELAARSRSAMTLRAAAAQLGVSVVALSISVDRGVVQSIGGWHRRRIPYAEVQRWVKHFNTLNEPFAWLQPLIVLPRRKRPQTLTVAQAATRLGISYSTAKEWGASGLLPYFPGGFTSPTRVERLFVRLYILSLCEFAGKDKVTKEDAWNYLELCKQKNCIA